MTFELLTAVLQVIHVLWDVALCCQVFQVLWMIAVPSSWGSSKVLQSVAMLWGSSVSASHHWGQGSSSHTLLFGYIANLCLVRASAWTLTVLIYFVGFLNTRRLVPQLRQARFLPDALWFIINRSFRRCVVWSSESVIKYTITEGSNWKQGPLTVYV